MAKILVADDDATARALLATVLGYAGHLVQEAQNGAEALARLPEVRPDLIVVDLLMPKMDGLEFLRRVRQDPRAAGIPIVFYTASYLQSEAQQMAVVCGVSHIITKPADPEQIFAVVNAALKTRQQPSQTSSALEDEDRSRAQLTAALSQKAALVVPRLDAMIALGLRLGSERDPARLLGDFCDAARTIIGAAVSLVLVRHNGGSSRYVFASGLQQVPAARQVTVQPQGAIYEEVMASRMARRLAGLPGDAAAIGLPSDYSPVTSLLCVPVQSPQRVYGYALLLNRVGASHFSDEDEALAHILSAQIGRIYENGSLYREVKLYAERLEEEIEERKAAEDSLRALNEDLENRIQQRTAQLQQLNGELEAFGYTVSHDLRAPLRALSGYSSMLMATEADRLSETGQRYLQTCVKSAQRMGEMVNDLLAFSRLGRQALSIGPVDMAELIREVWNEAIAPGGSPAELRLHALPTAVGDRALLREVWANLISNALKYSARNTQPIVEIEGREGLGGVQYSIRDNGVGFDMTYVRKLFRVFERLHSNSDFEGTGAGLAIVERILQRHGGRIWAQSEVGQGATFHFILPLPDERSL